MTYQQWGAGSKPNSKVRYCYTCSNRGFPHEAISFVVTKEYGNREVTLVDYFSGLPHQHRYKETS